MARRRQKGVICQSCGGSGKVKGGKCKECGGRGWISLFRIANNK